MRTAIDNPKIITNIVEIQYLNYIDVWDYDSKSHIIYNITDRRSVKY